MTPASFRKLTTWSAIRAAGPDARSFLQGQLSHDLERLTREHSLLACCNSPQGRVQAVLTLIERSDGIFLFLPATLLESTLARLRKYMLRAKVTLGAVDAEARCFAASRSALAARGLPQPAAPGMHIEHGDSSVVYWRDENRYLLFQLHTGSTGNEEYEDGAAAWRLADIRAGLPQVFPETQEAFVAQMLNLDLLDGISFNKGCYTGQEIIARTHYRGAIKRRMFRLNAPSAPPPPGARIVRQGQHAGDVVMSAATDAGCELLAVLNLAEIDAPLELAGAPGASLKRLPLPYSVPIFEHRDAG